MWMFAGLMSRWTSPLAWASSSTGEPEPHGHQGNDGQALRSRPEEIGGELAGLADGALGIRWRGAGDRTDPSNRTLPMISTVAPWAAVDAYRGAIVVRDNPASGFCLNQPVPYSST